MALHLQPVEEDVMSFQAGQNYYYLNVLFPALESAVVGTRMDLKADKSPDIFAEVIKESENEKYIKIINEKENQFYKEPVPLGEIEIVIFKDRREAIPSTYKVGNNTFVLYPEIQDVPSEVRDMSHEFLNHLLYKMKIWGYEGPEQENSQGRSH